MRLSILICTMPQRAAMFRSLAAMLGKQWTEDVEILYNANSGTTGAKRNTLLQQASGDYICFVDDDDEVSDDYVRSILNAVNGDPDCIGIHGYMTTNGRNKKDWFISKDHSTWFEKGGIYYRHTNHLSPVKRSIALSVGFPDITFGEDYQYSMALRGLLQTEVKIRQQIYHYKYNK